MRAKIIQYNSNEGTGLAAAEGRQIDFTIRQWRGEIAPSVNRVVEIEFDNETGAVASITPITEEALLKEKAAELKAKLGGVGEMLGGASALFAGGGDSAVAQTPWQRAGIPMLAAYAVFFFCTLLFDFATFKSFGMSASLGTMWGLGESLTRFVPGASGSTPKVFLILAWASVAAPMFARHRLAPLAAILPLLVVLGMVFHIGSAISELSRAASDMAGALGGAFGRNMARDIEREAATTYSLQFGFYACLLASAFTAFCGVRKLIKI